MKGFSTKAPLTRLTVKTPKRRLLMSETAKELTMGLLGETSGQEEKESKAIKDGQKLQTGDL